MMMKVWREQLSREDFRGNKSSTPFCQCRRRISQFFFFFSFGFYSVPLRLATSFISILVQSPQVSRLPRLSVNSTDQNDDIQYLPSLWFAVLYGNISGFFSPFLIRWLCFDQKRKPPRRPIIMRWQRAKISLRLKIGILIRRPLAHSLTKPKERDWRIFFFLFSFNRNLQRV